MTLKLSLCIPSWTVALPKHLAPLAVGLLAGTVAHSLAHGQSVYNRYSTQPSIQPSPTHSVPSFVPSRNSYTHPTQSGVLPPPSPRFIPATPTVVGSASPVPTRPISPKHPNFADVQEVGRGLGTPGLITPGSVERMERSGLVIEDFRPPQPRADDFSWEGLPPEARRAFYDQLQIPEGGRVMSARVLPSAESAPSTPIVPDTISLQDAAFTPIPVTPIKPADTEVAVPLPPKLPVVETIAGPVQQQITEAEKSVESEPKSEAISDITNETVANQETVSEPQPTASGEATRAPSENIAAVEQLLQGIEERIAERQILLEATIKTFSDQNVALEKKLAEINDRLVRLESSSTVRESDKGSNLRADDKAANEAKTKKGDRAKRQEKEDAPDKKKKSKPKDRIDL